MLCHNNYFHGRDLFPYVVFTKTQGVDKYNGVCIVCIPRGRFLFQDHQYPLLKTRISLYTQQDTLKSVAKMAETMGDVITIDNFQQKMPKINPSDPAKPLYGLVDMGRCVVNPLISPRPQCLY